MDPETQAAIDELGTAIRAKDWPVARQRWEWLLLHHPYLRESNPDLSAALRDEEEAVAARAEAVAARRTVIQKFAEAYAQGRLMDEPKSIN